MQKQSKNESLLPGRGLDAIIAEKVMNLHHIRIEKYIGHVSGRAYEELVYTPASKNPVFRWMPVPSYSTDIAAAWEVVENLQKKKWNVNVTQGFVGWITEFYQIECKGQVGAEEKTVPHAICIAALKAVGELMEVEVSEDYDYLELQRTLFPKESK